MEFNLERFVQAQEGSYLQALSELKSGRKVGHWIWFIFPQMKGLGRSSTSAFYGIASLEEARAYLGHSVLGPRLLECTAAVKGHQRKSAEQIFGELDAMKFRSSMTLFARAAEDPAPFGEALAQFFGGQPDPKTEAMLSQAST